MLKKIIVFKHEDSMHLALGRSGEVQPPYTSWFDLSIHYTPISKKYFSIGPAMFNIPDL